MYLFGPYEYTPSENRLTCHGQQILIQTKSGALLEVLLQRAGDVVSRHELLDLLWPDEDVEESNLSQHVFMLRGTFAQATPDLTVIVTVHRKGYRFVLPVRRRAAAQPIGEDRWRWYVQGLFFAEQRTLDGLEKALDRFKRALESDPGFASAYSGLADAYVLLAEYLFDDPRKNFDFAQGAAERALELDPQNAAAECTLGDVWLFRHWDAKRALETYDRGVASDSTSTRLRISRAWYFSAAGDRESAMRELRHALDSEPYSLKVLANLAAVELYARRYEAAINICNDVVAMDDHYQLPRYYLATALALTQNYERAHAVARGASSEAYVQQNLAVDGFTFGLEGDMQSAAAKLTELKNMSRSRYISPFNIAQILVGMRQHEAAIDELERGAAIGDPWQVFLAAHPAFDPLRGSPRFNRVAGAAMKLSAPASK